MGNWSVLKLVFKIQDSGISICSETSNVVWPFGNHQYTVIHLNINTVSYTCKKKKATSCWDFIKLILPDYQIWHRHVRSTSIVLWREDIGKGLTWRKKNEYIFLLNFDIVKNRVELSLQEIYPLQTNQIKTPFSKGTYIWIEGGQYKRSCPALSAVT